MKLHITASAALLFSFSAMGAETNQASSNDTTESNQVYNLGEPKWKPETIAETYFDNLEEFGSPIAIDSFGPDSSLDWTEKKFRDGYAYVGERNAAGRAAVENMSLSGLRETAVNLPLFGERDFFAADLLDAVIGDTLEDQLDPGSPTISASEVLWEEQEKGSSDFSYGFRPFDRKPYVYQSSVIRNGSGKVLLFENLRIRYIAPEELRFEGNVALAITHSWQLDANWSGYAISKSGNACLSSASIGISRVFSIDEALSLGESINGTGQSLFVLRFSKSF